MTPLSEMTLHQLCAAIARNVYRAGGATDESLALDRELSRRQRMLDAAERLYKHIIESDDLADAAAGFAVEYADIFYSAAKESRSA